MATATRRIGDSPKALRWLVRNERGDKFGPVDFATLKIWACDGRLAPTNEISENGTDWKLATTQSGIGMDWVAEVTPGTFYGPIHHAAMEELVRDGSIAARAPFFRRHALDALPAQAAELEQVRRQAAEEVRLAGAAQQQASAKADALERQLAQARQEQAAAAAGLAELRAESAARAAVWAAQEQAFESERQALRSAVGLAQAEAAARVERETQLEAALAEAGQELRGLQALEPQVQGLCAEREALRSALAEERQRAEQALGQCAALSEAAEEARRARSGESLQAAELRGELARARQQAEALRALFRQAEAVLGEPPAPEVFVERADVEPMEAEPAPPARAKAAEKPVLEAEVLSPERPAPAGKPPVVSYAGHAKQGLSLAELEQQARRELERLGTKGPAFFKKKK